jgi:hypothetical protein
MCDPTKMTVAQQLRWAADYMRARGYLREWETYSSNAYRDYITLPRWELTAIEFEAARAG